MGTGKSGLPILEQTELFARSIGEATDIVEKEMYTFPDRNDQSLTLRPGSHRRHGACGHHNGLFTISGRSSGPSGPMFRYEKPQKGRNRQFHQFDVEAMGYRGPDVDAELIIMCARMWRRLGLVAPDSWRSTPWGPTDGAARYREALVRYFSQP